MEQEEFVPELLMGSRTGRTSRRVFSDLEETVRRAILPKGG